MGAAEGLKRVRKRRNDALAGEAWDRVERLLADYYRRDGYAVEHCGTGGQGERFDGGVDLRLRRDGKVTVVQCKHWNAYKVPHNDVHQLLGIMVNEGASSAILVTSGEFTKAAIEAAQRHNHVQLVDGDDLREMLGPLPDQTGPGAGAAGQEDGRRWGSAAGAFGSYAAERLVSAAEDRIRHGGGRRRRSIASTAVWAGLWMVVAKFALALALIYFAGQALQRAISNIAPVVTSTSRTQPVGANSGQAVRPTAQSVLAGRSARAPVAEPPVIREPSAHEIRQWERRNAESMEILRDSTPELPLDPRRQ
jgi:hypothetical protein